MNKIALGLFLPAAALALLPANAAGDGARAELFSPSPAVAQTGGPVVLSLADAVLLALKNNRALAVQKYGPEIAGTGEEAARGAFDTTLTGSLSATRSRGAVGEEVDSATLTLGAQRTDERGLTLEAGASVTGVTGNKGLRSPAEDSVSATLTATQALLRGANREANLASVRQAALDAKMSAFELRGYAQSLVANTETAFWDYLLAKRRIQIVEQSLELATAELAETEERIRLGKLPELELSAAKAEVALRREAVIEARGRLATVKLNLARLTGLLAGGAGREITLVDPPLEPVAKADDVEDHVKLSRSARPELNEARLRILRNELEVVKTKDGLLPKLDAFATLGKSGYSDSISRAFGELDGRRYTATVGLTGNLPWEKSSQNAADKRAALTEAQSREALANLVELAEVDVRTAHVNAEMRKEQIAAISATRKLREDTLYFETEKHRVGRSTSLLVAGAQRDLLESRLNEAEAEVAYNKALVELFLQDGTLLRRLGITAPGEESVTDR